MRVAVYGGSFDPPHVAHVLCAHYLLSMGLVDKVIVVPVYQHAFSKVLAPYALRVEMCEQAFARDQRISVSQIESQLPSPSYTLRTVRALKDLEPEAELRLVIGADVLSEAVHWYQIDEVKKLAPLLVLGREGVAAPGLPSPVLPDVSSTLVRRLCSTGASAEDILRRDRLVPASVLEVIFRAGLYGSRET